MPDTLQPFVSRNQGHLFEKDIERLKDDLTSFSNETADGNGIFFEGMLKGAAQSAKVLLDEVRTKLGSKADEMMPRFLFAVRELVAQKGLVGGHEKMKEYAKNDAPVEQRKVDGLTNPMQQEDAAGYDRRLNRIETLYSLVAWAMLEESARERMLGMVMATYLEADPKIAEKYVDVKNDRLNKLISEKTPSYELLCVVEFCEQEGNKDLPVCKDAKFAAMEFLRRRLGDDYKGGLEAKKASGRTDVVLNKDDVGRIEKDLENFAKGNGHDNKTARVFFPKLLRDGASSALKFIQETERLAESLPDAVSDVLEQVRHRAYATGVFGGYEIVDKQAIEDAKAEQKKEGIKNGDEKGNEDGEAYASRMRRIRSFYALLGFHMMDEEQRDIALGKPNTCLGPHAEKAAKYIDIEKGTLVKEISEQTPLDDLVREPLKNAHFGCSAG